ncbi:MAG TPA: fibronectin type III domain-containing protein [Verrucomicrobiae bacterium]|jgi:hypothetical protein
MTQGSLVRALHVLAVIAFITHARTLYANSDPRLEWDPSLDPNVAGYRVYNGEESRNYTHVVDVGLQTGVPLTNLSAGITHYLAVTAYDVNQIESPLSDEIWYTPRVDGINNALIPFTFTTSADLTTVQFNGHIGQQCRVVASSNMIEWHAVHAESFVRDDAATYYEDGTAYYPKRFFRVVATPPWQPNGPLPFTLTVSPSVNTIEFMGRAGQPCRILSSFDMNNWYEVYSVTPDGSTPVVFYDHGSDADPMRFYRVVAGAP